MSALALYGKAAHEVLAKEFDLLPAKTIEHERRMAAYWDNVFAQFEHAERSADADAEAFAEKV